MKSQSVNLSTIPLELFLYIVSFIDTDLHIRHTSMCYDQPTEGHFAGSEKCIKALSTTCGAFREILAPMLYRHLKLDSRCSSASQLMSLVDCLKKHTIQRQVDSVLVRINAGEDAQQLRHTINRLFSYLDPPKLILVAPPAELADILCLEIYDAHSWVFQIPFQVLYMERPSSYIFSSPTRKTDPIDRSLFALRPWEKLLYNEGSSARAYSTYEFHNHTAPSLFASNNPSSLSLLARHLPNLRQFSFVAVFPINGFHGGAFICNLSHLEHLEIQFAPSQRDSQHRPLISSSPGASASDFWSELLTAYGSIRESVDGVVGPLQKLTIRDYAVTGYRHMIESVFVCKHWEHGGNGTWHRQVSEKGAIAQHGLLST